MLSSALSTATAADRRYRRLAGIFFLLVVAVYYWPSLGWLPRGIHEWAQADRLALAISFYDHGLNLLRPQTLSLSSVDGVVGVEFPLVPYLAALAAKVVGRAALVPLYRLLTIATAWLAYYYLFRLVFERTRQFAAALLPGVFLAVSPVFAYYAGNFLPDPASASLVVVATYYLLRYQPGQRFGGLAGAIALFTLAALIKVSAAIYLVAALGTFLLWGYLQPAIFTLRQRWLLLLLAGASLGAIAGYTIYNQHLNQAYQSTLFLAKARPFESAEHYDTVVRRIRESWSREYFVPFQYQLLLASALVCLLSVGRIVRTEWVWAVQLGLAVVGGTLFFRLMGAQFFDHDYYVLASFWPGLVLLVALATSQLALRLAGAPRLLRHVLFGAAVLGLLVTGLRQYRTRMADPYLTFSDYYTYRWMQGGAAQLAAARVPAKATILVIGEDAPNLSLVYFDRRGLVWNPDRSQLPTSAVLQKMTEVGLDYLIMRQAVFQEVAHRNPDLEAAFSPLISTKQYVVLQRRHAPRHWE
jgi:4-amino-4-deoxy-L-arabinose transferase-like glycosyltransferase